MKFIVDAQLPKSLSDLLRSKGVDSIHTLDLPDKNKTKDGFIAQLAVDEQRIVISKNSDYLESYLLKKVPSQLLLVETGNIRNQELLNLFEKHLPLIQDLFSKHSLLEITQEEIVVQN